MNEALRMQLKKDGSAVRCTLVSPYYIDTGELRNFQLQALRTAYRRFIAVRQNNFTEAFTDLQECLTVPDHDFHCCCRF